MAETTCTKRLVIGQQQWGIPDDRAEQVAESVQTAMTSGTQVQLVLRDPALDHDVTVYLNGAAAASVEVDLLKGPRPTEMSKRPS